MLSTAAEQQLKADFQANTTWLERNALPAATLGTYASSVCIVGMLVFQLPSPGLLTAACVPIVSLLALNALGNSDAYSHAQEEALMRYIQHPETRLEVLQVGAGICLGSGKDECTLSGHQIAQSNARHVIIPSIFSRLTDPRDAELFASMLVAAGLSREQLVNLRKEFVPRQWRKKGAPSIRNFLGSFWTAWLQRNA